MKKLFLYPFLLLFVANLYAGDGIQFSHRAWQEILAKAKKENKLVLIDVFTTWCGPCKMMVAEVFPQKPVGDLFNASFVNYKIDAEKGEGIDIARKSDFYAYPTYLFVDGNGELIYRLGGYRAVNEFLQDANIAIEEKDDPKPIAKWDAEYKKGKMSKEFLLGYVKKRQLLKLSSTEIVEELFPKFTKEELANKEVFSAVISSDYDVQYVPQGKVFNYGLKNYKRLDSLKLLSYPLNVMQTGISNYFQKSIIVDNKEKMLPTMLNASKQLAATMGTASADLALRQKELVTIYYRGTNNEEKLKPATIDFVQNDIMKLDIAGKQKADEEAFGKFMEPFLTGKTDSTKDQNYVMMKRLSRFQQMLNLSYKLGDAAEGIFKLSENKDVLVQATEWARLAYEWFPHFSNGAVYAALVFKTGNTQKAVELMEMASKDPILSGFSEIQKLFLDNIDLMKKGEISKNLWRVSR